MVGPENSKYLHVDVSELKPAPRNADIRTKRNVWSGGRVRGGVLYGKGALAHLLKNRCYIGEIYHRGAIYRAEHEPIVDRQTFEAVQRSLAASSDNARKHRDDFLAPRSHRESD
jgi:hypothetical protein